MCGIAGIFYPQGRIQRSDVDAVQHMNLAQKSRGPDGDGIWLDPQNHCVLGHTRLAILDRSEAGRQPMSNADSSVVVSFNGEIYNYQDLRHELERDGFVFRSQTDTEVLIHGYTIWRMDKLVSKLRGMFAFSLYDTQQRTLYLVRDRLGIKPLYWRHIGGRIAFASTVKALLATGWPVTENPHALVSFIHWGSVTGLETTVKEIGMVPPATIMKFSHTVRHYWPNQYWNLTDFLPRDEIIDPKQVRAMLEDVVSQHLQSDVPVGVFLSGGVDSSVLAKLSGCSGLTISFPEDSSLDEMKYVGALYESRIPNERSQRSLGGSFQQHDARSLRWDFESFIKAMDQPSIDGFNTYLVSKLACEQKYPVTLSGLGADELFAGYTHLKWLHRKPYQWLPWHLAWLVYQRYRTVFKPWEMSSIIDTELVSVWDIPLPTFSRVGHDLCQKITYWEFTHYLHDQLLRDTDWASMAHGVEVRVPYLDHKLIEAILPVSMKLKCRNHKYLLIEAVKDLLPRKVWDRPKQGFELPFARWLKEDADFWQDMAMENTPLKKTGVAWVWKKFRQGKLHWSRAWAIVIASQWSHFIKGELT